MSNAGSNNFHNGLQASGKYRICWPGIFFWAYFLGICTAIVTLIWWL